MPAISGSPFSDALVNLNQYTAHLLYKCASDPSSSSAAQVPNSPPALLHLYYLIRIMCALGKPKRR